MRCVCHGGARTDVLCSHTQVCTRACFVYTGSTHVRGLTLATVASEEEAMAQLFDGETNRAIAEHQLNKASTRYACATHSK